LTHKLSIQLRAAEERIAQLQGDVERLESRAIRAERWLETIKQDKLLAPMETNRPELPALHRTRGGALGTEKLRGAA